MLASLALRQESRVKRAGKGRYLPVGFKNSTFVDIRISVCCKKTISYTYDDWYDYVNTKTTTIAREALVERYQIPPLPPHPDLETRKILKALTIAHKNLAELKGRASSIPNQGILIDTLMLQEAAASSGIENIVTTKEELFQIDSRKGI